MQNFLIRIIFLQKTKNKIVKRNISIGLQEKRTIAQIIRGGP